MSEEGLLGPENLHRARWKASKPRPPSRTHAQPRSEQRSEQVAEARQVLRGQGPQGRLQPVNATLHLRLCCSKVPQAAPFGSGGEVKWRGQSLRGSKGTQVLCLGQRSGQRQPILFEVEIGEEEPRPFHQPSGLKVGRDTYLFGRSLKVLEAAVHVPGSLGNTSFCKGEGRLVHQHQLLGGRRWKGVFCRWRTHRGVVETVEKALAFWGQSACSNHGETFTGPGHAAASVPYQQVDLTTTSSTTAAACQSKTRCTSCPNRLPTMTLGEVKDAGYRKIIISGEKGVVYVLSEVWDLVLPYTIR